MKAFTIKNAATVAVAALSVAAAVTAAHATADPNANYQTKRTFDYINTVGKMGLTLSMQHCGSPWNLDDLQSNPPNEKKSEITRTYEISGRYPAIIGLDWLNSQAFSFRNTATINLAKDWTNRGGIVQFQFHEGTPRGYNPEDTSFYVNGAGGSNQAALSSGEWNDLLNNNSSSMHQNWQHHMDLAAGWMQQLQSAGVVILWRPYHEGHGNWFWWGGNATNYKALWKMQFNYLTNTKGLHNLLWVTSASDPNYYPGDAYVDITGFDEYTNNQYDGAFTSTANSVRSNSSSKTLALTETGLLPANSVIQQNKYAWVAIWDGGFLDPAYYGSPGNPGGNTNAQVQSFYWDPHTICLSPGVWNGQYKMIARNSGLALDAYGLGTADGTQLGQYAYGGGANQKWAVCYIGNGQYIFGNQNAAKPLDVIGSGGAGTFTELYSLNTANNQRWVLTYTDSNNYRVSPAYNTALALDVYGAATGNYNPASGNNGRIDVYSWFGTTNQQWSFQFP